jgi:hypothetical protein
LVRLSQVSIQEAKSFCSRAHTSQVSRVAICWTLATQPTLCPGMTLIHDTHAANVWPAGHADSFEEFMAKKQRKEREEQARKAGVTVGGGDGDDDDDVCGSVEECEAIAGSGSSAPKPAAVAASEEDDDVEIAERGKPRALSARDEYKNVKPVKDTDPVKTALVTVLRVQESTLQVPQKSPAARKQISPADGKRTLIKSPSKERC